MINGQKPKLVEGMVLVMEDGSQRRVVSFTPGAHGEVRCATRRGHTGSWGKTQHTWKRRDFWKGVDYVKE